MSFAPLLACLASLPLAYAADPVPVEREIVFLLDTSGSMTSQRGAFPNYDAALAAARSKAERIVSHYAEDPSVVVSLYHFGDIRTSSGTDDWEPNLRPIAEQVGARAAIEKFGTFFLPARDANGKSNYTDPWTYVAATVHEIVSDRYDLKDDCAAPTPRDNAPQLTLFVLTDGGDDGNGGGESAPRVADREGRFSWTAENERRKAWLARQDLANALSYTHWDVGVDSVVLAGAENPVYRVQWTPKQKGTFNLRDTRVTAEQSIDDFEPRIRLIPEGAAPSARWREAHPELICAPRAAAPRATAAGTAPIDIVADWVRVADKQAEPMGARGPSGSANQPARLDGLSLAWDARATRGSGYALTTQRADLEGRLKLFLPLPGVGTFVEPNGSSSHALRMDRDSLCEVLQDAYPGSTFRLPPDTSAAENGCTVPPPPPGGYALLPVAQVSLVDREVVNTYEFGVSAEGRAPVAGVSLGVDRWWRATGGETRTFRIVPLGSVPAGWTYTSSVTIMDAGRPLEAFSDVASFGGPTSSEGAPDGAAQSVTTALSFPGRAQRWFLMGTDFPNGADTRDLSARVCFDVRVPDPKKHEVSLKCADCGSFERVEGAGTCLTVPVHVDGRPIWAWWRIAAATLATIFALWAAFRWWTRPRFPPAFTVGGMKVRAAAEAWRRDSALLRAQLAAVYLDGNQGLVVYMDIGNSGVVRRVSATPTGTYCLALRARPGNPLAWCRLPEGTRLSVAGIGEFAPTTARPVRPDDVSAFLFTDDASVGVRRGDDIRPMVDVFLRDPEK
jgi:hypothetical protein